MKDPAAENYEYIIGKTEKEAIASLKDVDYRIWDARFAYTSDFDYVDGRVNIYLVNNIVTKIWIG
jgi:hypothetical protein